MRSVCLITGAKRGNELVAMVSAISVNALFISCLFVGTLGASGRLSAAVAAAEDPDPYRISVNIHLVVLQASVRNRDGQFVTDLNKTDFEVYEDGVKQTLRLFRHEDAPVTVGLVVDHSGSMRQKLPDVIAAARTFVQFSRPDDEMFVVNFNDHVVLGLPPGIQFTHRQDESSQAISGTPPEGKTSLYDAIVEARKRLDFGRWDKKVLIVISDGGDNASVHSLAQVLKLAGQSSSLVYTIGIFDDEDRDKNPGVLKRLANATGGEALFPTEPGAVVAACERVARDIRNQYTLGYVSSNPIKPGAHRTIKVSAHAEGQGKLNVRARSGYFAAAGSLTDKADPPK